MLLNSLGSFRSLRCFLSALSLAVAIIAYATAIPMIWFRSAEVTGTIIPPPAYTWIVDDDGPAHFRKIQEAINAASDGDKIFVRAGTYYENVVVNKTVLLVGESKQNTIIDGSETETVVTITADNITLSGFTIKNGGFYEQGIKLHSSTGSIICDNNITNNRNGIRLDLSDGNNISGNTMTNNERGVYLSYSDYNVINSNTITNNVYGIGVYDYSKGNIISGNTITANRDGDIELGMYSNGNTLSGNTIANSYIGIILGWTNGNIIYHNNLIHNTVQVWTIWGWPNTWDDGYPSGGNYWSDYIDVDLCNGPNQDLPGMDGIWDHPYLIDADNKDRYPLVKPYPTIPVTVDVDPDTLNLKSKGQWITAYIQLPEGYDAEDIDATTILLNKTIQPVLDPKYEFVTNSSEYLVDHNKDGILERMVKFDRATVESFIYNQGIRYEEVALTLTGNLLDGTPFEGTDIIFVNYAGDANNDGIINVLDAGVVSAHWHPGPPTGPLGYDENSDFNKDEAVDILDAGILSVNWGQTTP